MSKAFQRFGVAASEAERSVLRHDISLTQVHDVDIPGVPEGPT